jgi:hypothetical protein
VRSGGQYLVALGHERADSDEVVEQHERYVVVSRPLPVQEREAASTGMTLGPV